MLKNYSVLRWKLIVTILAFSVLPLMGLGYFIFLEFNKAYSEKAVSSLKLVVDNKQRAIDLFLQEKVAFLRTIAYSNTYDNFSNPEFLRTMFDNIQSSTSDFVDIGVIDALGNHVNYIGPYRISDANYGNEEWFFEVKFKGVHISDVFMGFRKYPHFIIAVLRREGERSWILRATVNLEAFNSLVQTVQTGRKGDAYLVNRENILQTPSRFNLPVLSVCTRTDPPIPFQGVRVEERVIEGKPRLLAMSWLTMVKWMLVVTEDPREVMSPMIKAELNALLVFLAGLLIVCLGALYVALSMVRKIMEADREAALLDASLMQSNKMAALGKLAAGVAHEVNNPLTLIRESAGWVKDLLTEEDPKAMQNYDEIRQVLDKIDRHVERAKEVTHRMLGFGRRMDPRQENVNVNSVLAETVKFMENEAMHRNIAIVQELDPKLPLITTDPAQMQQVFLNIIDNGIDAIDKDGTIILRTQASQDGKEVQIVITDTGSGIPPEQLEKIFDPFYTTKKVGEGTGLGLAIVFSILEKLHGRIVAESQIGQGTTFTISFPVH